MLKNDESDHYKHYDSEKTQWTCLAAFALLLSIAGLIIFLVMRPEMPSKLMITLFTTQIIVAGISRLTFFARGKHQNHLAIILVTIASLIVIVFIMVFINFCIVPLIKDFANFSSLNLQRLPQSL